MVEERQNKLDKQNKGITAAMEKAITDEEPENPNNRLQQWWYDKQDEKLIAENHGCDPLYENLIEGMHNDEQNDKE